MKTITVLILKRKMEGLRRKMIVTGVTKGFTHRETILLSQKLDRFMNRYGQFLK